MSREPRVDAYIAKAPDFARPILEKIRERVHATVPDVVEAMKWSAPGFTLDGKLLLIMAAFRKYAAINLWRGQEIRGSEASRDAMGQFGKLASTADLPADRELDSIIRQAARLATSAPAPRKTKHAPKPAPELHADFASALAESPKAKAALESFPPSAQRDYLEWISEAKQDATRNKRIATSIEWLIEGKRRNWKYENC